MPVSVALAHSNKAVRRLLAVSLLAAAAAAGCDNATGRADREVLDTLAATPQAYTAEDAAKNVKVFEALAKNDSISTGRKALAKAALAQAELQGARYAAADLQAQESLISAKLWEIDQIVAQSSQVSAMVAATKLGDPNKPLPQPIQGEKTVIDALKNDAAAARGADGGAPWVASDTAPLATVSAVRQTISNLTGKITEIKTSVDSLTQKRTQMLADASKAEQDSQAAQGDASEKLYIQSADLRKQAAMTAVQIEQATATMVPLQQDLTAAQEHEKIVTAAADGFDATSKSYGEQFADVQQKTEALTALGKSLISGDKGSITSRSKELNDLVADADATRSKATELYKASISHFTDAASSADRVKTEVRPGVDQASAEAAQNKSYGDAHEPSALRLQQADASQGLAAVDAGWAMLLTRRDGLTKVTTAALKPMSVETPADLVDAKLADEITEARTSADEAYKSADDTLDKVSNGATPNQKIKSAAKLMRAAVNVGWSQLAAASGNASDAKDRMAAAQGYAKEVSDDSTGVSVPMTLMILTDSAPSAMPTTAPAGK